MYVVIVLIIKNVPSCCVPCLVLLQIYHRMAEASSSSSSGASSAPAAPSAAAAAPAAAAPTAAATAADATAAAHVASSSQTKTAQKTWELRNNIMEVKVPLSINYFTNAQNFHKIRLISDADP
jgi:hypothetical protein